MRAAGFVAARSGVYVTREFRVPSAPCPVLLPRPQSLLDEYYKPFSTLTWRALTRSPDVVWRFTLVDHDDHGAPDCPRVGP